MNYRHLAYFVEVYESGSIVEAAKKLYISSQGLGQGLHRLEKSIGIKLFDSTSSGLVPTEFGTLFYGAAKKTIAQYEELEKLVNFYTNSSNNTITIGITGKTKYERGLQNCIDEYRNANPQSSLHIDILQQYTQEELVESVRNGHTDMGMMFHTEQDPDFNYYMFNEYSRLMVLLSKDNPLATRQSVQFPELASLSFIFPAENDPFTNLVRSLFCKYNTPCNTLYCMTEYNMIGRMTDNNYAAMFLREHHSSWILPFCTNSVLLPVDPEVKLTYSLFCKKGMKLTGDRLLFTEWMKSYFDAIIE